MPRSVEWFIKRVSVRIDEIVPSGENVGGQTAIEDPVETIRDELDFSVQYVLRRANLPLLYSTIKRDKKHFHGDSVNDVDTRLIIDSNRKATIVCPEDFFRFVACRLSGWTRDLKSVLHQEDPRYRIQEGNNFTSGSPDKPEGAMVSFGDYVTTITHGGYTGTFSVGEEVTGGTSSATATVKEITSDSVLTLEYTSGHFQAGETITGGSSAATCVVATDGVSDEYNKWVISHDFTTNQTVSGLDDSNGNISTDQIFILTGQDDPDEDGTYKCNATGTPPTKLSDSTSTINSGVAIECFRAATEDDTIEKFHYIPKLTASELPDDLIDSVVWVCASRVLEFMGRISESDVAMSKADALMGTLKLGLKGEA